MFKIVKCLFLLASLIFFLNLASAATNITSCGTTISSSGQYELNQTLNGTATCLTIASSHVSIDCKGNLINYGSSGGASTIGINAIFGVVPITNLTIKDCILNDVNASGATGYGIMLTRSSNSYIFNNTIRTNGTATNHGIFLTTSSSNNLIENNTIYALGSTTGNYGIHLISNSRFNIVRGNVVNATGTTTSYALFVSTSSGSSTILNNTFTTTSTAASGNTDGNTVYFLGSNNNIIRDNYIYGDSRTRNYVAYFSNIDNTTFSNNQITYYASGTTNYGIYGIYLSNSAIEGNTIWVNGTTTNYGVYLSSSTHSTIINNSVTAIGTSVIGINELSSYDIEINNNIISAAGSGATNYGIQESSSYSSAINNNTINVTGTTPLYGIHITLSENNVISYNDITSYGTTANSPLALTISSNNNLVANNTLRSRGNSTLNYGIYVTQNIDNIIESNNITTNGTTTNYGVYLLTNVKNTKIKDNTISTYGTTTNYGVYLSGSNENLIIGNNITTNGTTKNSATNNWGIHLAINSQDNTISNNTVITDGGALNYGLYLITNSGNNIYSGNSFYSGGNSIGNYGAYVSESHNNLFNDNLFSTSGNGSEYGVYLHSSSRNNNFTNNNITTSGGTDSHAFHFLFVTPGYPEINNINRNYLYNISGRDFNFATASINGTTFIDQSLENYSFTGIGGLITVRNTSAGQIRFLSFVNGTNTTFSNKVFVINNFAKIDELTKELNKSAEITLYNLPTTSTELQILRNGVACSSAICTNLTSLQAGNVTFNVAYGGEYSINSSTSNPVITLGAPPDLFNSTNEYINFNFTAADDISSLLNCSIYLNNSLNITNSTVSTGILTNFLIQNIQEGNFSWYVSCFDEGLNLGQSIIRKINISYITPSVVLNSPSNESYFNNANSINLNFTVYDQNLNNMTVWVYGNGDLLNTYYNLTNGSNIAHTWENLSIKQYNWTVISNNGLKNSSNNYNLFNVINLTMNCETGGPYQSGALVLAQGNISDGLNGLSPLSINISAYNSGVINASKLINSSYGGSFQTTLSNLANGDYTLNASFSYQGYNKTCSNYFNITSGTSSTSASLVLDKLVSLNSINSTEVIYNVSLFSTNMGGSNANNVLINDTDSSSPYYLGTLPYGTRNQTSYSKSYLRNSTGYSVTLAVARINGTDAYLGNEIHSNSSSIILFVPAINANTNLTIIKNAQFSNENATSVTYNLTSTFVNSGGYEISSANISDADINLNALIDLNISQGYTTTGQKTISKTSSVQIYNFLEANATHNSVLYESNQISLLVPSLSPSSNLSLYKSASVYYSTNTNVTYNVSLGLSNLGGRNITGVYMSDSNSVFSPYNIGNLTASQISLRSYLITLNKSSSEAHYNLSVAMANGTDSVSGELINVGSDLITLMVPPLQSSASLVLDKIANIHNFTNEEFIYNITLRLTNKGGSNSISTNITDSNYNNSYFDLDNLSYSSITSRSYLLNFSRNSTTYYSYLNIAQAFGIDSYSNSLINANSTTTNITIPSSQTGQQITLVKNAYFNSENSTAINYTLNLDLVNSGGVDLSSITVIDTDLDINNNIDLNRTENKSFSGILIIQKAASNTEKTFVKASATINSATYQSNQIKVNIPGYGGPADTVVYAPDSVNSSSSFDTIIEITNQNQEMGQNFVVDYWITNEAENTNYTSGQQTVYVAAFGITNVTATLTSPSVSGNYRFRALVSYIGGPDLAFDTFEVTSNSSGETTGSITGSGSSESGGRISGQIVGNIICNEPYIRHAEGCCLDKNNNTVCDSDELAKIPSNEIGSEIEIPSSINKKFNIKIREMIESIKDLFLSNLKDKNKNIVIIIGCLILAAVSSIIIYKIVRYRNREINRLNNIVGIRVYSSNGNKIGRINKVYIDLSKSRIYGLLVKLEKNIYKKFGSRNIIIKYKHIRSIKDVAVIDKTSSNYLERIGESTEI
jgi:sporulation protein YlmC with PRC-barrel domain